MRIQLQIELRCTVRVTGLTIAQIILTYKTAYRVILVGNQLDVQFLL